MKTPLFAVSFAFASTFLVLAAVPTHAQEDLPDEILNQLNLAPQQSLAIRQARESIGPQLAAARDKHMLDRKTLRKQMMGATASDSELTALFNQVMSDVSNEKTLEFQLMLKVRATLNPDQRVLAARAKRGVQPGQGHSNPAPTNEDDLGTSTP